jgi:DnaK suppressor protein
MSEKDLLELKAKLLKQRRDIFRRLHNLEDEWQTLSEHDIEIEEEAQKAALAELFNQLDLQEQQRIEEIDLALTKMAAAAYGVCETCQKAIPLARLRALPATPYCLKCSVRQSGE